MTRRSFIVLSIATVLAACVPWIASAATLYFSPASKTVSVGQTFTVSVGVSTPSQAMNAASGDISFPTNTLRVLSVSNTGSIMNLWVQNPSFSNAAGAGDVNFAGVALTPGFTGNAGTILTIRFQAMSPGNADLVFSSGAVLANDGDGTNILVSLGTGDITVTSGASAPVTTVTPSTAPAPFGIVEVTTDPTDPQPIFQWNTTSPPSGIQKYLVKIGDGVWFDASQILASGTTDQYQLPLQAPGDNIPLAVDAYNNAGAMTESTTTFTVVPLPTPTITDYSKQLVPKNQILTAEGTSTPDVTITLYLQQGNKTYTFSVPSDDNGNWSIAENVNLSGGNWYLKVQSQDQRGALSLLSPAYTISTASWFDEVLQFIATWGVIILLILLMLAALIAIVYYLIYRLRHIHVYLKRKFNRELEQLLREDLRHIEHDIDAPGELAAKRDRIKREIERLKNDLDHGGDGS